jgi:hypothetical protein
VYVQTFHHGIAGFLLAQVMGCHSLEIVRVSLYEPTRTSGACRLMLMGKAHDIYKSSYVFDGEIDSEPCPYQNPNPRT